jgi:hypothetical protein
VSNLGVSVRIHSRVSEERLRDAVTQSRAASRYGGSVLNNAVQKAYRERVAAGLIKPQEEFERKPVVLISTNGGRLVEADEPPPEQMAKPPRREPKRRLIGELPKNTKRKGEVYPRLSWIVEATARYFELSVADITGPARTYKVSIPRQVAMYLAREVTTRSTTEVGVALGGRDHTTVMHGAAAIKRRMAEDPELATKVGILRQIILNGMYVGGNDNGGALG